MTGESRNEIGRVAEAISAFLSGGTTPEEFRRRRVIYGIYPVRGKDGRFLLRVRIPLGRPTAAHLRALADVADRFAQGRAIHLTTRQDVHIYGIGIREIPEAMTVLADAGLTTREACGDTVRNIVVCPYAGVAHDEIFDVTPYADALGTWLLRNPLGQRLPRKFKIAFEGCADEDHVGLGFQDVGVRSVLSADGRPGFRVSTAGGLGALPRAGIELEPFSPASDLAATVEALLRLFDRMGDREKRGRARLKFVAERLGEGAFREAVKAERGALHSTASGRRLVLPEPETAGKSAVIAVGAGFPEWPGAFRERRPGSVALPVRTSLCDVTPARMRELAGLVVETGASVRLTPAQGLLLAGISASRVPEAAERLRRSGFSPPSPVVLTRCAGTDTCTVGITRVRALAALLEDAVASAAGANGAHEPGIAVKISGCANGCGHHLVADIGLQGVARNVGGRLAPHFLLFLGGGVRKEGGIRLGAPVGRIPVRRVREAVSRAIRFLRSEARGGETAGETIARVGVATFEGLLRDLLDPPPQHFTEEDFLDLGADGPVAFPPERPAPPTS